MKTYKYSRSAFGPLPAKLEHVDLFLSFAEGEVHGVNRLRMTARTPLDQLVLDAKELSVEAVEWLGDGSADEEPALLKHDYRRDESKLVIALPRTIRPGETFVIRTYSTCVPTDNILEGIYKDTTPEGCPQQYMSQCQQWGFQRILPILDDCTAKCTMTTTLEADARYTHLISNGNIDRKTNPDGVPVPKPGSDDRQIVRYVNEIPMAPYLFLVCAGTWDTLEDEVVYPSGRKVRLEYLVPPGRRDGAAIPMQILKDSVLWQGASEEYEYKHDVYRTICMEKSNFGGMENVGNTTIVTDAALIDEYTSDRRLEYAYAVIVHEFEHNQCGSEVTMETPFDMWLNEAFTVDVERRFVMSRFDATWARLDEVDAIRAPIGGPLAIEDAGHQGNIVREGFNDPDELVDGVTYVKAAEVIRMLRLIIGAENFRRGKNLYFSRHAGGNANTAQFFACFEEISGRDLSQFKKEWLHSLGYPKVTVMYRHDHAARRLHVSLRQDRTGRGGPFHVPVEVAAVDEHAADIPGVTGIVELTGESLDLVFEEVPRPAFMSFNRDGSFYGAFADGSVTPGELLRQIRLDPNLFNRVEAMRQMTDIERIRLIKESNADISPQWLETMGMLLSDRSLKPGLKSYLLRIDEQSLDRDYQPAYRERYRARKRLIQAVGERYLEELMDAFRSVDTYRRPEQPKDGIEERALKAVLLRTIVEVDQPATYQLAEEHFRKAWNITDKISALQCINLSHHPARRMILEEAREHWKDHLSAYSSYLAIVGGGIHEDLYEMIEAEQKRETFHMEHPNHARALFLPMSSNNKMLWTDTGIQWVTKTVIRLAPVNEMTAGRLVACFQLVDKLADDLKPKVRAALEEMREGVDANACPSVAGRLASYLR